MGNAPHFVVPLRGTVIATDAGQGEGRDGMKRERQWQVVRSATNPGYFYTARVGNQTVRIFVWNDARKTALVWRKSKGHWIQEVGTARARGLITMTRKAKTAPGYLISTYDDPRDARVPWQAIDGGPKKAWRARTPENTKRTASPGIAEARGQRGNTHRQGSQ